VNQRVNVFVAGLGMQARQGTQELRDGIVVDLDKVLGTSP